jgi:hypothetical protein
MLVRGQPLSERELIMKRIVSKDFMRSGKEQKVCPPLLQTLKRQDDMLCTCILLTHHCLLLWNMEQDDHRVDAEEAFLNEILRDTGKGGAYYRETFRRGFQGGIVLQENERGS